MTANAAHNWRLYAACRSADPDLFFPVSMSGPSVEDAARAKAFCLRCRVQRECLAFAVATRQAHGIWGGLSEQERHNARPVTAALVSEDAITG